MKRALGRNEQKSSVVLDSWRGLGAWFDALKHSWRTMLRVDRAKMTAGQAIYSTLGFVLPLVLGVATGHIIEGVSIAGGAVGLGSVGLNATSSARIRTMLLACVGLAFSAFMGSVTSHIDWLAILVAGVWGIGIGLFVPLGKYATPIGLQSGVALIVLSHFALDPLHAALQAFLMFAGALWQTGLAWAVTRWQRTTTERAMLSLAYEKLAAYMEEPTSDVRQVWESLLNAHETLAESSMPEQQWKVFHVLLEEADRIRLLCIVLSQLRQSLKRGKDSSPEGAVYLKRVMQAAADELRDIANDLKPTHPFTRFVKPHQQMKQSLEALRRLAVQPDNERTVQQILAYCGTLRDHLHQAKKLARSWRYKQARSIEYIPGGSRANQQSHLQLRNALTTIRANLTLQSAAFRHAIRLGVVLTLATALYRIGPWPIGRGYWIPLTALLVLKPDFTNTFARGLARTLGTMLGVGLTTALVALLVPSHWVLVGVVAVLAYLAFSSFFVNYALFTAFVTSEVVFLLTFIIPQPLVTAFDRALDTLVGGMLALLIYALWPTWELKQVPSNIAGRISSLRDYGAAVLRAYADPTTYDEFALYNLVLQTRLTLSNAEASVQRSLQEPAPHQYDADLAHGLLEASDAIALSLRTLESYLLDNPVRHALPEMSRFARHFSEAMNNLATAIREHQPVEELPDWQADIRALDSAVKNRSCDVCLDLRGLIVEARNLVKSITLMYQLLTVKRERETKTLRAVS